MRWEWPWMLGLLLVLLPVLAWQARRPVGRRASVYWVRVGRWGPAWQAWLVRATELMPVIALAIAAVALARPQQGLQQSEVVTRGVDIMLAIDISPSMAAEDF